MLASLLGVLSLSALPAANAFPRWQRQARQVDAQAQASLLACPAPVTSFVPIITTIPECTEGNACATNTIISQGQPYITSTLVSSTATGAPGDVIGGTTVVNNGASASNVAFPAATVCTADCVLGGVTYTSGTVFYSTSAVAPPSATVVVGGSTLTGTTAPITSASAVTLTYFSTIINNVPVTDGSQPLTTITAGPDGVSTTIIQPASQVITSLQNSATPGLPTGAPGSNVITVIVPGPSGPVTQIENTGPGGVPTTIFPPITSPGGNGDAPATTPVIPPVTLPGGNGDGPVTTPVIPPVTTPGSNGDGPATTPIVPPVTNPGSTPVISAGPSTNVLPTSSIDVIGNPGNNAGTLTSVPATSAADDQDATSTIVDAPSTSSGALAETTSSAASDIASSSVTGAPSTTSETLPATTSSVGQTCFTDSDCDGIILGICVKAAGALATDIGVCVDGTPNTASSTISGTSTIDAGASSSTSASTLPTGGPGIFPVATCTEDSDCFLGVCLQAGLTPLLGTGLGVCLGSSTNPGLTPSSTAGVPLPTQSVIPGTGASGSCTSDSDCLIGICLDASLAPVLGLGTGICLGNNPGLGANPTTGGNGATSTVSGAPTGNTSPVVASCDATTTCAVGVCLGANLLPITGAGVGICLGQNTDSTTPIDPSTGSTPAAVSCGSTQDCLIGLCLNLGILGGNVCVGSSSSLVNPSVSASLGLPSVTGLPTISVDLPGATGLPTISADLPGVTGLPGLPTGAIPCTATEGCLVGVCAQIGLFNLGTDVGICVGSTGSSSGLVDATISADLPGLTGLPTISAHLPGATGLPGLPVGAVQCSATQGCLVGVCAQIGAFNLGSDIGICVGSTGSSSGLVDATISVDIPGATGLPTISADLPGATGLPGLPVGAVQCSATQGCLVGVCAQIGAFNLGSDIGICVGSTGSSSGLVDATISVDVPGATGLPTISADLPGATGLPGLPVGAVQCSATQGCLVGVCAQIGAFNLGSDIGICVGSTGSSSGLVDATISVDVPGATGLPGLPIGAVQCSATQGCLVGVCAQIGAFNLGSDIGICVGSTDSSTGLVGATITADIPVPTLDPTLPGIPTGASSCSATDACAVGICAQLGAFNLGTGVGVCVDPTSQKIITASVSAGLDTGAQPTLSVPSVTVSDVLATQTGTTCGPNVPCAIGACVNVGLLGLGADVGLCVLEGVDPLVTASVGATVLPNPATLPAVPAPTVAASASVDVGVTVAPPSPTVAPAPSTLVTSIAPAATIAGRRRCTTSADCTGLGLAAVCVNGLDIIGLDVNICA